MTNTSSLITQLIITQLSNSRSPNLNDCDKLWIHNDKELSENIWRKYLRFRSEPFKTRTLWASEQEKDSRKHEKWGCKMYLRLQNTKTLYGKLWLRSLWLNCKYFHYPKKRKKKNKYGSRTGKARADQTVVNPWISAEFGKYFRAFVNLRDIMSKLKLRVTNVMKDSTCTSSHISR